MNTIKPNKETASAVFFLEIKYLYGIIYLSGTQTINNDSYTDAV